MTKTDEQVAHTPGPWKIRGMSDCVRIERRTDMGYLNIARCGTTKPGPHETDIEETWANAKLIVVAPELLAALKAWEKWYSEDSTEFNREMARDLGLKAIAKAEGRA